MSLPDQFGVSVMSDRELVARAAAGDDDAFAALVTRYSDFVFTIVVRIVIDEEDARDVAQDAFVRAHRALGKFRGDSKFSSWLYRIAVNRALTHLKQRKRRPSPVSLGEVPQLESSVLDTVKRSDPERDLFRSERARTVVRAVEKLPPNYRTVVTLFYLEERSYKEVAAILGIPMGTLKTYLHRARAILRQTLAREEDE